MRINHNLAAMNTYRQLSTNQGHSTKSLEKLSSGLRINRAGDDAAGLAISEKMRAQVRGLDQASRNSQDGISMIQTAEGALNETHSILQRMRELATQSSNDTNVEVDRDAIQNEMNQLTSEINRIGNTTEFNTQKLLDGGAAESGVSDSSTEASGVSAKKASITGIDATSFTGVTSLNSSDETLVISVFDNSATALQTFSMNGDTFKSLWDASDGAKTGATDQDKRDALVEILSTGMSNTSWETGYSAATSVTLGDVADIEIDDNGVFSITHKHAGDIASTTADIKVAFQLTKTAAGAMTNDFGTLLGFGSTTHTFTAAASSYTASSTSAYGVDQTEAKLYGSVEVQSTDKFDISDFAGKTYNISFNGEDTTITLGTDIGTAATGKVTAAQLVTAFQSALDATLPSGSVSASLTTAEGIGAGTETYLRFQTDTTAESALYGENQVTDGETPYFSISGDNLDKLLGDFVPGSSDSGGTFTSTFQVGANQGQSMTITIDDMRSKALEVSSASGGTNHEDVTGARFTEVKNVSNGTSNDGVEYALDVSTHDRATAAVKVINNALEKVSEQRSELGGFQNRLEHTINNLNTSSENLQGAESRIRDVDMAKEMMAFTKNNILTQAAQSMLSQANQQPQGVLSLLR